MHRDVTDLNLYFYDQFLCLHADLFGMKMIIQTVLGMYMYDFPLSWAGVSDNYVFVMKRLGILVKKFGLNPLGRPIWAWLD